MTRVLPSEDHWLAGQLADLKRRIAALEARGTQYVVDPSDNTGEAIVGNLLTDQTGNLTGMSGFGLGVLEGSIWRDLGAPMGSDWAYGTPPGTIPHGSWTTIISTNATISRANASVLVLGAWSGYVGTAAWAAQTAVEWPGNGGPTQTWTYFFNAASDHRICGLAFIRITGVPAGSGTFTLLGQAAAVGQTITADANDAATIAVVEIP